MADAPDKDHFTIHLEVTSTRTIDKSNRGIAPERKVTQIANLTVRDSDLVKLLEKVAKHLALVEEV